MKKISLKWYFVAGCFFAVACSPLIVNSIARGEFSTALRADYVDGLGVIVGWLGRDQAQEELYETGHLIRHELAIVTLEFKSEEEADAIRDEAFKTSTKITGFGRTTLADGSGEVRFKVPDARKEKIHSILLAFQIQFRDKKEAQQDMSGNADPAIR